MSRDMVVILLMHLQTLCNKIIIGLFFNNTICNNHLIEKYNINLPVTDTDPTAEIVRY